MTCMGRSSLTWRLAFWSMPPKRYTSRTLTTKRRRPKQRSTTWGTTPTATRGEKPAFPVVTTTRDRIRRVIDHNQVEQTPVLSQQQLDQLVGLAQGRLSWARNQLFEYWNPNNSSLGTVKSTGGNKLTTADAAIAPRRTKQTIVMDAPWWFWNIAFALLPACLIGLYCEFRGQYLMHAYHQKQELLQMTQIMGDDYVAQHKDELLPLLPPPPDHFGTRIKKTILEIQNLFLSVVGTEVTSEEGEGDGANSRKQHHHHQQQQQHVDRPALSQSPAPLHQLESTKTRLRKKAMELQNDTLNSSSPPTLENLLERIQYLEQTQGLSTTGQQQQQIGQRPATTTTPKGEELRLLERSGKQSGIQNRMEDSRAELWRKKLQEITRETNEVEVTTVPKSNLPLGENGSQPQLSQTWQTWKKHFSDAVGGWRTSQQVSLPHDAGSERDHGRSLKGTPGEGSSATPRSPIKVAEPIRQSPKRGEEGSQSTTATASRETVNAGSSEAENHHPVRGVRWWPR